MDALTLVNLLLGGLQAGLTLVQMTELLSSLKARAEAEGRSDLTDADLDLVRDAMLAVQARIDAR